MINNYFTPLEFQISIKRLPNVEFYTQSVQLPGISTNSGSMETNNPFGRMPNNGTKIQYSDLDLTFIIDENMQNYFEISDWIKGLTYPENFKQFKNLKESRDSLYSDISILISNSSKNPKIKFTYEGAFPVSLSGVQLDTTSADVIHPKATVTFTYLTYKYEIIN